MRPLGVPSINIYIIKSNQIGWICNHEVVGSNLLSLLLISQWLE